jgi:DNA-binding NarL/FixJ family response regulator
MYWTRPSSLASISRNVVGAVYNFEPLSGRDRFMNRPCILLADDNSSILHLARQVLTTEFTVVSAVSDGTSVLSEVEKLHPDIVILDISMGEPNGIEVAHRLRESGCNAKILFLTVHQSLDYVQAALAAGASAYVIKSRMNSDLVPAVRSACLGRLFVSQPLASPNDCNVRL